MRAAFDGMPRKRPSWVPFRGFVFLSGIFLRQQTRVLWLKRQADGVIFFMCDSQFIRGSSDGPALGEAQYVRANAETERRSLSTRSLVQM